MKYSFLDYVALALYYIGWTIIAIFFIPIAIIFSPLWVPEWVVRRVKQIRKKREENEASK